MSYENVPKNLTEKAVLVRGGRPDFSKLASAGFPTPSADEAGAILENTDTGDRFRWSGTTWIQIEDTGRDKVLADIVGTVPVDITTTVTLPVDVVSTITVPTDIVSTITLPVDVVSSVPIVVSNNVAVTTELTKTAHNEVKTEDNEPITQLSAKYGLLDLTLTVADSAASGTNSVIDDKFTCSTGTSSTGLASILSLRQAGIRAGQGLMARFDAQFTVGAANSQQAAGLVTSENSYVFGYLGTVFGLAHAHGGVSESRELTITIAATGAENATITVDGVGYTVALTAGTAQHNALEISNSLNTQVPNYSFTSNDDQVVAQSLLSEPQGSFAFTSATAVAAWVQTNAGLLAISGFIAQADWNVDTRLTGTAEEILDPTKGNEYQIQLDSNFGAARFYVEDSDSGRAVLVHVIAAANLSTTPNVTNPTFRIGWFVRNLGNTTDLVVSGSEASAFIEGKKRIGILPRAEDNDQLAVGTMLTNIIAFRNRIHFGGKVNRAEILPLLVTLSTQTNKSAFFEIRVNPTFGGDLDFFYKDKSNSIMEIATDAVTVSGGRLIGAFTVVAGNSLPLDFNADIDADFVALPGTTYSIASRVSSGAASDMQATSSWREDIQ